MGPRAEIVITDSRWSRAARIVVQAPPQAVFDVVADPTRHALFDGSGMVEGVGMQMRYKLPYRTSNEVVEFEDGRRIAWCHFNHHRWRYEFEPTGDGATLVTETFDGSTARFPPALLLINAYENNQVAVAKTLVRLKGLMESDTPKNGRAGS